MLLHNYKIISKFSRVFMVGAAVVAMGSGCITTMQTAHTHELPQSSSPELTLGVFQQNLRVGMSQGDVAASVGSPNMVNGSSGNETWIYDKIASESSYSDGSSSAGAGVGAGILAGGGSLLAGLGGGASAQSSKETGVSRSTQKTLTVVLKFENSLLKEWKYHTSKF